VPAAGGTGPPTSAAPGGLARYDVDVPSADNEGKAMTTCTDESHHQWVVLPGGGYWQASFAFDPLGRTVATHDVDGGVPMSILPVIGWRYCVRCETGLALTVGILGTLEAAEPDGGLHRDGDMNAADEEVRIVFHHDARTAVGPRSLDDAPEWVTDHGRSLLAEKASRWEAAQRGAPADHLSDDHIHQRAAEIERAWVSQPATRTARSRCDREPGS
jgi:hypothetical protein